MRRRTKLWYFGEIKKSFIVRSGDLQKWVTTLTDNQMEFIPSGEILLFLHRKKCWLMVPIIRSIHINMLFIITLTICQFWNEWKQWSFDCYGLLDCLFFCSQCGEVICFKWWIEIDCISPLIFIARVRTLHALLTTHRYILLSG